MTRPRWLLPLLGLALTVLLALALRNVIGAVVVRGLLGGLWAVVLRLTELPRVLVWGLLLMILALAGAIAVLAPLRFLRPAPNPAPREAREARGRVEVLTEELMDVGRGPFFRRQLLQHLSRLTVAALKHRDNPSTREAQEALAHGDLPLDAALRRYLADGLARDEAAHDTGTPTNGGSRLRGLVNSLSDTAPPGAWHDPEFDQLVELLESELEVRYRDDGD
jgi:hypothetical protein